MKWHAILLFFVFSVSAGAIYLEQNTPLVSSEEPLVLGVFPRFSAAQSLESYTPMVRYLSKTLRRRVRLVVSEDFDDFWEKLSQREFDIAHLNQYHYIRAHKELGYDVFGMNEEQGKHTMTAAIVVRNDSGVNSIDDLRGKRILFGGNQQAMISYIYATYLLRKGGLREGDYQERFEINPPTAVVATFHGLWDAAAAGTGDIALGQPVIKKQVDTSQMRYLTVGEQFSQIPWALRRDLEPELKERIANVLLTLKKLPEGKKIFKKALMSGIAPARDSDFDAHRRITRLVLNEQY